MNEERKNKLFYFTASKNEAQEHLDKTIRNSVNLLEYGDIITDDIINSLDNPESARLWGATPGPNNKSNWEKLKNGDRFLIYGSGKKFVIYGKTVAKTQNRELAERLWGTDLKGNTWEYIFFVEIISEVAIGIKKFNDFIGYSANFTPQGFSFISESKLENIYKNHDSIDDAILSLNKSVKYENAPEEKVTKVAENDDITGYEGENNYKKRINKIKNYIAAKGFSYKDGLIENFYLSLKTKPFVLLAGISGTGKTKLVQLFAEAIGCDGEQFKFISVRPDWSDTSDLLGYNDIQGKFQPGPLIKTIKAANQNLEKPYIVCLDEMNLARVEYYFSDFLSKMETRKYNNGSIKTDQLLADIDINVNANDKDDEKIPEDLYISENLYIIGTVNMDETTHPFSKKVLDRANTIEFNEINLMDFPSEPKDDLDLETLDVNNKFLKTEYLNLIEALPEKEDNIKEITLILRDINNFLKPAGLQVGYRIRDEINFYMIHADKHMLFSDDPEDNQNAALDFQIKQKILPRIQGSSRELKNILIDLFDYFAGTNYKVENRDISDQMISHLEKNDAVKYPLSAEKVAYMIKRYELDGFTAFWI